MAMRWYVVHVYSGSEKRMAEAINDQIVRKGMQDYFAEVLVPTEEVVEGVNEQNAATAEDAVVVADNNEEEIGLEETTEAGEIGRAHV